MYPLLIKKKKVLKKKFLKKLFSSKIGLPYGITILWLALANSNFPFVCVIDLIVMGPCIETLAMNPNNHVICQSSAYLNVHLGHTTMYPPPWLNKLLNTHASSLALTLHTN